MKNERQFYRSLLIGLFVTVILASYLGAQRLLYTNGILSTGSAVIYPLAYFIFIIFTERYGKKDSLQVLNIVTISMLVFGLFLFFINLFNIYGGYDELFTILNVNWRLLFAFSFSFVIGLLLLQKLYLYLINKEFFNFLFASVIAITVESITLITLGYVGDIEYIDYNALLFGQTLISVLCVVIYSFAFGLISKEVIELRKKDKELDQSEFSNKPVKTKKPKTIKPKKVKTKKETK